MKHEKVTINGRDYVTAIAELGCSGCAFNNDIDACHDAPDCFGSLQHNPQIIFVENKE